MATLQQRVETLKKQGGYWIGRITAQLSYALQLSAQKDHKYDSRIGDILDTLESVVKETGLCTPQAAREAENALAADLGRDARRYTLLCVAHAHIDMNWMWDYAETTAVTLETFRTMLHLMEEYPDFTFSQSQASVYRIVETHDPEMLEEIRRRVREGRWEVTASTWVETDKNMPTGESLARHILYTKRYLKDLLDLPAESLKLDFEPDTFGHSRHVPEILADGGVEYYYHCRGLDGEIAYRWEAPSGRSVIVYRDPDWYNGQIVPEMVLRVPAFCGKYGVNTALHLYGVGDHGGGPTRHDIEQLLDMAKWPAFPTVRFGTLQAFFTALRQAEKRLPVVRKELNFVFTGCYTTQTRIKMANRISEAALGEAETLSALAALHTGSAYRGEAFAGGWEKTLFNQFHDILPGSGVMETREYALGQFQQVMAVTNTEAVRAMRAIASGVDTRSLAGETAEIPPDNHSEGAGVGYGLKDFGLPQTERGAGIRRIYHVFNTLPWDREEQAVLAVWDWPGDRNHVSVRDAEGNPCPVQLLDTYATGSASPNYWGHTHFRLLVRTQAPACGYRTLILDEGPETVPSTGRRDDFKVERHTDCVLENSRIRVSFNEQDASVVSFLDKISGCEMLDASRGGGIFRLAEEDDIRGMTAWVVGRYMSVRSTHQKVKIRKVVTGPNLLRQFIIFDMAVAGSTLSVTATLDRDCPYILYNVECDWQERPVKGSFIPQLHFYLPLAAPPAGYRYDVPFGVADRVDTPHDVPANSWAYGIPADAAGSRGMLLTSGSKYGFRGTDASLSLTLIRSSYNPDPYPELGMHRFWFAFGAAPAEGTQTIIRDAKALAGSYRVLSGTFHPGDMPAAGSFLRIEEGSAVLSAVKLPEQAGTGDARQLLVRVYEPEGRDTLCRIRFGAEVRAAWFSDLNEKRVEKDGQVYFGENSISFMLPASSVATVCVELANG